MTLVSHRFQNPDLGLLLIRLMLGVVGVFHGGQKLFGLFGGPGLKATAGAFEGLHLPQPTAGAVLAGAAEFFGGILLALGIFPRLAALPWAFAMFVAAFKVHYPNFSAQNNGMEYPLTLAIVLIGLFFTGPGRLTLAHAFGAGPRSRSAPAA
jgi:putative oxidoreductase